MLWDGRRVPFTLLAGYLGAGKTTIVNHVVAHAGGRRIVVLVNDVGAVNVDAALIADHDGETLSLTNGCVCCAIADDFTQTLEQVRSLPERPDHVLMELSGVAEPGRVAPWADTPGFALDGIVVAVDAEQIGTQVDHPYVGDTIRAQLAAADLLVLTKTDLLDGDASAGGPPPAVRHWSTAPVVSASHGAVDVDVLLGVDAGPGERVATGATSLHRTELVDVAGKTVADVEHYLADLPDEVVRVKGVITCVDEDAPVEVQVVGRRRIVRPRPDLERGRATDSLVVISVGPSEEVRER